jgi:hypothetical protein
MILIGISGKKRTGKNTVASLIKSITNQTFEEFALAQDLKLELATLLKIKVSDIETSKELYRPLLQALGCFRREFNGQDYWVNKCFRRIYHSNADVRVITDIRFENEVKATQASGGLVVRVSRDIGLVDTHESETALDGYKGFDHVILNTGSLEHLLGDVKDFSKKIGIKLK